MFKYVTCFVILFNFVFEISPWDIKVTCPERCTCSLKHFSETSIYGYMKKEEAKEVVHSEVFSAENNDVLYEDNFDVNNFLDNGPLVRSTICLLDSTTNPVQLLEYLSENVEAITLIHGYSAGNKTIQFSQFENFKQLISLEFIGSNILHHSNELISYLHCEIDVALPNLKYLNFERVLIKSTHNQLQKFIKESSEKDYFEYIVQYNGNTHPITLLQKRANDEKIVPYGEFQKMENIFNGIPLFTGFSNLNFLRITNLDLKTLHWEMFRDLKKLEYFIFEKNNLRFISSFAFFGTPNLKTISLAHNDLLDIEITDLAGLLKLEILDLSFNNFTQLSELSLPPFPNLRLAKFGNNPISMIYPNTFEVMNTTDELIIGSTSIANEATKNFLALTLLPNSFVGLDLLKKLTINNINQTLLTREILTGMPNLLELTITGNLPVIQYDAFIEVKTLTHLLLRNCQIFNISMDGFFGLENLEYLDLSNNNLEYLPPGIFDSLLRIKEIFLNNNKFQSLPKEIFIKIHPKMLRLNENPWHCSCDFMSDWKPIIINRIKQRIVKPCDDFGDKGIGCATTLPENRFIYKYIYDNRIAPKCFEPKQIRNWSVFHVMKKIFRCPDYKPKYKKHHKIIKPKYNVTQNQFITTSNPITVNNQTIKIDDHVADNSNNFNNNLNPILESYVDDSKSKYQLKFQKKLALINKKYKNINNNNINIYHE